MTINLQLKLSTAALMSVFAFTMAAQAPAPTGKIHGHVTDPTGVPKGPATISLSQDQGHTMKYSFPVSATGEFAGDGIAPGTYAVILRLPETPAGQFVDEIDNVKIVAGTDVAQDDDMSREEYLKKMSPEQRKQVEEYKKKNAEAMKGNAMVKVLNTDLAQAREMNKDKKYADAETLMMKDTGLKPDGELLWYELAMAQLGQKKYDDASTSLKKVLDLETTAKKPNPELTAGAHAAMGEALLRGGKVPEGTAEYDLAATAFPTKAGFYYTNEAVVDSNIGNADAQAASADKAITADPKNALPYYLKGQALAGKITVDAKSGAYIVPPGLLEADNKYLELAPTGPYVPEVKAILEETQSKVKSTYKAPKK